MHSRVAQTWAKLSNAVTRLVRFVWLEEITNLARCSDQINRAGPVGELSFSGTRMCYTLIILLRSTLSAHCGKLVFPGEGQPGVKKQAAGGQGRRMPSIKNSTDDLRREECEPQQPGGV